LIGLKDGEAKLETHSKEWEKLSKETIYKLKNILGNVAVEIQHVGSTRLTFSTIW